MTVGEGAVEAYLRLGWRVDGSRGRLELITGTVVDALEVPRAAGLLAAHWWLYTDGCPDEIRELPAMPSPAEAMVVIAVGDRSFFLVQAGGCPWITEDPAVARASDRDAGTVIRWHSVGSRIPFPPGQTEDGHEVAWTHLPARRSMRLARPAVLLHLLAKAAEAFQHGPHMLTLPGNVLAIPVLGDAQVQCHVA
jgi:hypothetical protein